MSLSDKIRALLKLKGKTIIGLGTHLGIAKQTIHNKLQRNAFTADELIKTAEFCGVELAFIIDGKQRLSLEVSDLKAKNTKHDNEIEISENEEPPE